MSQVKTPDPVLLIMGVLHQSDSELDPVIARLESNFGSLLHLSDPIPFTFSDYYDKEMGSNLQRRLLAFYDLIAPERLAKIKRVTNVIEDDHCDRDGGRTINLDPGYISLFHMILASCKAFAHRPYLGMGVYADLTLLWKHGKFETLPWTYPDYADKKLMDILTDYRSRYVDMLKQQTEQGTL